VERSSIFFCSRHFIRGFRKPFGNMSVNKENINQQYLLVTNYVGRSIIKACKF
jgi:hypothetical protein